jgi:cell division protein FtsB
VSDPAVEEERVPAARSRRRFALRRLFALGALALVGLLYYRPLKAYVDAHGQLAQRAAAVHKLEHQRSLLQQRLRSSTSLATLAREARGLGYVKPGEHLFIVKGINSWRKRLKASLTGRAAGTSR